MPTLKARRLARLKQFPGYVMTDHGEVYSYHNNRWGISSDKPWRKMIPTVGSHGYPTVKLKRADGVSFTQCVHILVLTAFVGLPQPGQLCRHKDGNRTNAMLSNLAWSTQKENLDDQLEHGTRVRGAQRHNAKASEMQICVIRELACDGIYQRVIGATYGMDQSTVSSIVNRKTWTHI